MKMRTEYTCPLELVHDMIKGKWKPIILWRLRLGYGLSMNFEQYVLVGSTVRSYLSWLKDTGKLKAEFQDSMLLWQNA